MELSAERKDDFIYLALGASASTALAAWGFIRACRARTSEVALFTRLPPLEFWGPALAVTLVAVTLAFLAWRRGWSPRFTRLPAMVFVGVAFVQLFVLPAEDPLGGALGQLVIADGFAREVARQSPPGSVLTSGDDLAKVLAGLPPPPLLQKGQELSQWQLRVFGDCAGPLTHVEAPAGTLIYCVAPDVKSAWVEVVGLQSSTYGKPELIAPGGQPFAREIHAGSKPSAEPGE